MLATTGKSALRAFGELSQEHVGAPALQAREAHRQIAHAYGESAVGRTYDPIGNRETSTAGGTTTSYAANELNQYESVGTEEPAYDEDGNLLDDGVKALAYNAENQLVRVEVPGVSVSTYLYDYIGRRVRKSVDLVSGDDYVVTWVYSGRSVLRETMTVGSTTTVNEYVWGPSQVGGTGAVVLARITASGTHYYLHDASANVVQVLDESGAIAASYEYDVYGGTVLASGTFATTNPFRFANKYFDQETGLYNYGYRYYDPLVGRFVNRDPIGEAGGMNLYRFARNAPNNWADAMGLQETAQQAGGRMAGTLTSLGAVFTGPMPGLPPDAFFVVGLDKAGNVMEVPTPKSCNCSGAPPDECLRDYAQLVSSRGGRLVAHIPGHLDQAPDFLDVAFQTLVDSGELSNAREGVVGGTCYSGACIKNKLVQKSAQAVRVAAEAIDLATGAWAAMKASKFGVAAMLGMIWKASDDDLLAEAVSIGGQKWRRFKVGEPQCQNGCEDVASQILEALGGGERKVIKPKQGEVLGGVKDVDGVDFKNPTGGTGRGWFDHHVVVKDGKVYDALTGPEGQLIDAYKGRWEYSDAIDFGF